MVQQTINPFSKTNTTKIMNWNKYKKLSLLLLAIIILVMDNGCKKNSLRVLVTNPINDSALLKVGYFTPWFQNRGAQIAINGKRVSNVLTYAISFPGGGINMGGSLNNDYLTVTPGPAAIKVSIPKVGTNIDSVSLFTGTINLVANKKQTVMLTDSVPNISATVIFDDADEPAFGTARMKFFNGMPNLTSLDLYVRTPAGIQAWRDIRYKGLSPFFDVPTTGADTFDIVNAGAAYTTANTLSRLITTPGSGRIYTILSRGFSTITTTTDVRRAQVSAIVNR
jgi:Domain of unknown function (DUF4397)